MRRIAVILLLLVFLGLGTGTLQFLHEARHAAEDAIEDARAAALGLPISHHEHDESNCPVCAQLHLQLICAAGAPVLAFVGLFVAYLMFLEARRIPRRALARIGCRGPPVN